MVKEIFRKRLEGYSALHIAEELNQMGVLSPIAYKKAEGQPYARGGYGDQKDCKWSAKMGLYEKLVNGCLSKEDYLTYKKQYAEKYDLLKNAIAQWEERIRAVAENQGDRNRWISHFLQFAEMETIDRRVVVQLIQYIKVISKTEIHIEFRYKDEYRKAVAFAEQMMRREAV